MRTLDKTIDILDLSIEFCLSPYEIRIYYNKCDEILITNRRLPSSRHLSSLVGLIMVLVN